MKYHLLTTKRFDKAVKKCLARGYDISKLKVVMSLLEEHGYLPAVYVPHKLKGYGKKQCVGMPFRARLAPCMGTDR